MNNYGSNRVNLGNVVDLAVKPKRVRRTQKQMMENLERKLANKTAKQVGKVAKEEAVKAAKALKAKKKEAGKKEAEPEPEIKAEIDWGSYLHPASVFESEDNSSDISLIKQDDNNPNGVTHKYYYVYIKNFPESEINQSRILSYQDFLNQNK